MSYELPNGQNVYGLTEKNMCLLDFLVTDQHKAYYFTYNYLLSANNENIAVQEYRNKKIQELNLSMVEFDNIYQSDKKLAFEMLFLEPLNNNEVNFIMKKMKEKNLSHKTIYKRFKDNIRSRWVRLFF